MSDIKEEKVKKKKTTNTAFILMFPTLILAGIAVWFPQDIEIKLLAGGMAVYQFLMMKKFIEEYYKNE